MINLKIQMFLRVYDSKTYVLIRTTRWLDRCLAVHKNPDSQNIFPIVQGVLDKRLRVESADQLTQRNVRGFAIGGLR